MPLTPSHSAAALLLKRFAPRLPLAALVIGSMSPDFEYLLRLAPRGEFGHTPLGLVMFCVPLSLAVWAAYCRWLRPVALELLPRGLAADLAPACGAGWGAGALAALLGALSHVLWDAFTHSDGWVVLAWPALASVALPGIVPSLRWYTLLQHASTTVGAIIVIAAASQWLRGRPSHARRFAPGQARRALAALCVLALAATVGAVANGARAAGGGTAAMLGYAAVGTMVGLALASVAIATYWRASATAR